MCRRASRSSERRAAVRSDLKLPVRHEKRAFARSCSARERRAVAGTGTFGPNRGKWRTINNARGQSETEDGGSREPPQQGEQRVGLRWTEDQKLAASLEQCSVDECLRVVALQKGSRFQNGFGPDNGHTAAADGDPQQLHAPVARQRPGRHSLADESEFRGRARRYADCHRWPFPGFVRPSGGNPPAPPPLAALSQRSRNPGDRALCRSTFAERESTTRRSRSPRDGRRLPPSAATTRSARALCRCASR